MSLRFVIGRSGSGKTTYITREMIEKLQEDPMGSPIIYIVPDQMTFLSEYKLISNPKIKGMFRLQVFSLTRLAWRVLQETGGIGRLHINSTGIQMMIRKIILEHQDELRIFGKSSEKFGFIERVEKMITEFKRYCISPEEIFTIKDKVTESQSLLDKLYDLSILYSKFVENLKDKYLASEDYLSLLAEKIPESSYLRGSEIYIDGFHSFTPQEYAVIEQLLQVSNRVTIALNLDKPYEDELPDEYDLFRMTGNTYSTLYEIAKLHQIPFEETIHLGETKRFCHPSLAHLEKEFHNLPATPYTDHSHVRFCEAMNPRAEVEGIARKILSLVRDEGYRYKDIAILARNGQSYHDLFDTVFQDYNIPFFIDQKRAMLDHPFIELIRSVLEVITGYWKYDPVFRAVKTELFIPYGENADVWRERMDRLENYCLAYGIQGQKWTSKERWIYRRYRGLEFVKGQTDEERKIEQELNESRLIIVAPIKRLANRLKRAENVKEMASSLFLFFEELDIPAKLEAMSVQAEEEGELIIAREHEQAWNGVIGLLDQMVELLGEEKISMKAFAEIMEAGLESLRYSLVPPAIDQVFVADLEQSRLSDIKIAFVIGLNDGVMPKKFEDDGLLTEEDRELLLSHQFTIAPTNKERLLDEEFLAYKAFTSASDYLYITYPLADEEGKALLPSPYIKRLKEIFSESPEIAFPSEPAELSEEEQLDFIANERVALTYITNQFQAYKRKYPISAIFWDAYNTLLDSSYKETAKRVLSSLFFENKAVRLSENTVKELYGDTIIGSISRMEMFNSCPFSHFLSHGLKLREREIFRLDAPNIGELFHTALKEIGEEVRRRNFSWAKLTQEQINILVKESVENIAPRLMNDIFMSSNRYRYLLRKLERVIFRATKVLSEQAKASGFSPVGMEVSFGPKGDLPPVRFRLKNGMKMELAGRIDRIDKAENEQGVFLRVIDYKSGQRDLNLGEVYYGIALQMLTYLDILMRYSEKLIGEKALPAGVLYFHIHNPMIKTKKLLTQEEIEEEIFKRFKMKGLVLSDPEVVKLMDTSLQSGESKIITAGLKRDGQLTARSKVATEQDFSILRDYVQNTFEKTGNAIAEGAVDIAPYKMKDRTPCQFCPFKSVCRFDSTLKENNYRILPTIDQKEALEKVKEALNK